MGRCTTPYGWGASPELCKAVGVMDVGEEEETKMFTSKLYK